MESNMSNLKRRLNEAIERRRSQASRLAGGAASKQPTPPPQPNFGPLSAPQAGQHAASLRMRRHSQQLAQQLASAKPSSGQSKLAHYATMAAGPRLRPALRQDAFVAKGATQLDTRLEADEQQRPLELAALCHQRNEFDPSKCRPELLLSRERPLSIASATSATSSQQQQVVEILMSDEEWELSQSRDTAHCSIDYQRQLSESINLRQAAGAANSAISASRCEMDPDETNTSCDSVRRSPAPPPAATNRLNGATTQKQYFIRYSLNNSIRTRRSHLRRSSARLRSQAAGRRSGRQQRQVRFQPVAQAIDISNHEPESSDTSDRLQQAAQRISHLTQYSERAGGQQQAPAGARLNDTRESTSRQLAKVQQQINKLSRKSRAQLSTSAKPLTRKLHSHLSQLNLGGLKLKSLNQFASQLRQQTSQQFAPASSSSSRAPLGSALARKGMKLLHKAHLKSAAASPESGAAPIQQTFHIRHSAAAAKHNITLLNVNSHQQQHFSTQFEDSDFPKNPQQQQQDEQEEDADGWGSDFDDTTQESQDELSTADAQHASSGDKNGYLLEIGKSSCDTRRIDDVIQDQGLSGHFKRLDMSACEFEQPASEINRRQETCQPAAESALGTRKSSTSDHREKLSQLRANLIMEQEHFVDVDEILAMASGHEPEEEDEAAELASLEARQGYRQVRDKLKLILDRRLAATKATTTNSNNNNDFEHQQPEAINKQEKANEADSRGPVEVVVVECDKKQPAGIEHHASDRFDCQSNCSEASSMSSGGLDSNHSGSQDSGHSTQHSGYSNSAMLLQRASGDCHRHRHRHEPREQPLSSPGTISSHETSPSINQLVDSGASTCGDEPHKETPTNPRVLPACEQQPPPEVAQTPSLEPEELERRHRFQQNRLLINSKLESMFRSRSGPAMPQASAKQPTSEQASPSKSIQSCPTPSSAAPQLPRHNSSLSSCSSSISLNNANKQPTNPLEAALRLRLLEQQRQMSLKLKQKPRRRTAKRALNLISSHSPISHSSASICGASLDEQSTNSSVANAAAKAAEEEQSSYSPNGAPVTSEQEPENSHHFLRRDQAAGKTRDSLSKQLSMVCLRQLQQTPPPPTSEQSMNGARCSLANSCQQVNQARGALSLRQLVKEVIDDCEKPTKMSTLTREILNRSDSLSSEGLASAIQRAEASERSSQRLTSSPLASASACGHSSPNLSRISSRCEQESPRLARQTPQIKPIGIISTTPSRDYSTPLFAAGQLPEMVAPPPMPQNTYYLAAAANDYSIAASSSLGTIDGLEFNPSLSGTSDISHHQLGQQPAQATPLQSVLKQAGSKPGRVGAYWKSLRQFSRFKMPKVNMAYLDNTDNFFADDDN